MKVDHIEVLSLWKPYDRVLDIGCGLGKIAESLLAVRGTEYIGIDCVRSSIVTRSAEFAHVRARFWWYDLLGGYNPTGTIDPTTWTFPVEDASQDIVLFCSVFTHIPEPAIVEHYLDETARVLRTGGVAFTSWFRSPPNELSTRWERTVHREPDIRRWAGSRFDLVMESGGETTEYHDQWLRLLQKR